ncbi:dihydroorotase [Leptolyngbya sp. AN02str]|uniref:dihydroorotase n=1 Tax=Leptolyngbya sp. AN02str TaxID=3423363 RepID=UPI003D32193E
MSSILLRQVRLLDPISNSDRPCDVWLEDGHIRAVDDHISVDEPDSVTVQDGRSLVLGPGLVDMYSHSGEPGYESRETLASLSAAAIAGGFTRISLLPDTDPALDNPSSVEWVRSHLPTATPQVNLWGALTLGGKGQQMTELAELAEAQVVGFADSQPLQNLLLLRRVMEYTQSLNKPLALWCCNTELHGNGVMREGHDSLRVGLPGIPAIAETAALAAVLECVEMIGTPVHFMRLSTARGVELVAQAKAKGLPVTASTTWMHVLLNTLSLQSYDPNLHIEPPLGTPADQAALVQAVASGVIDAIAIDHAPYTYEEKTVAFAESPPGMIGLELALPLLWRSLVETGACSALALWRSLSTNPAQCLGQPYPNLAAGQAAELTLFDPAQTWTVTPQAIASLSYNTPWLGKEIVGRTVQTWLPT